MAQLIIPPSRGLQKKLGMPVGVVPGLLPRGFFMSFPMADLAFGSIGSDGRSGPTPTSRVTSTIGKTPYGAGLTFGAAGNLGTLGYPIHWPSTSTPYSFEMLVYPSAVLGGAQIFSLTNSDVGRVQASATAALSISASANNVRANWNNFASTTTGTVNPAANALLHICVTAIGGTQTLYQNGVSVGTPGTNAFPYSSGGITDFLFGALNNSTGTGFAGTILYASTATVAWTQQEVMSRYLNPYSYLIYPSDLRATGSTSVSVSRTLTGASVTTASQALPHSVLLPAQGSRTNYDPNNTMQGAVAGTSGITGNMPDFWTAALAGLTLEISAPTTESGINVIDLRFHGTTTDVDCDVFFTGHNNTGLANGTSGQSWTNSSYLKLQAGSFTNVTQSVLVTTYLDPAFGYISETDSSALSITSTLTRFSSTGTAAAGTSYVLNSVGFNFSIGQAVDFTIRVGWPQLEISSSATTPILTSSGAVTADYGLTASSGSFTPTDLLTLTGGSSTTGTGSFIQTHSNTLSGASATTASQVLAETVFPTFTGNSVTSSAGSASVSTVSSSSVNLTGASVTTACQALPHSVLLPAQGNRTNYDPNNTMQGVTPGTFGSSGILPLYWTAYGGGLTLEISSPTTENGFEVMDLRFHGTTTDVECDIFFTANNNTGLANGVAGQSWTNSAYFKLQSGSFTNVTQGILVTTYLDSAFGYISEDDSSGLAITSTLNRFLLSSTAPSNTSFVFNSITFNFSIGQVVDFTIRVGVPQLEIGSSATPVIRTSSGPVTADFAATASAGSFTDTELITIPGAAITTSAGSFVVTHLNTLTGVPATSTANGFSNQIGPPFVGASSTTATNTFVVTIIQSGNVNVPGAAATTSAGIIGDNTITGHSPYGKGAYGRNPYSLAAGLIGTAVPGTSSTTSAGSFVSTISVTLAGAASTSTANRFFSAGAPSGSAYGRGPYGFSKYSAATAAITQVTLPDIGLTASSGSFAKTITKAITGNSATASSGSFLISESVTLAGNGLTATANPIVEFKFVFPGSSITTSAGSFDQLHSLVLTGAESITSAGLMRLPNNMVGVQATTSAGDLVGIEQLNLIGNRTVFAVGTMFSRISIVLPGIVSNALSGQITPSIAHVASVGSAVATTAAGNLGKPLVIVPIVGASTTTTANDISSSILDELPVGLIGAEASTAAQTFDNILNIVLPSALGQSIANAMIFGSIGGGNVYVTGAMVGALAGLFDVRLPTIRLPRPVVTPPKIPAYTFVPNVMSDPIQWLSKMARAVNGLLAGQSNTATTLTLTPHSTTTVFNDSRIGAGTHITLMPLTHNAANTVVWFNPASPGSIVINHASDATTDRTFRANLQGIAIIPQAATIVVPPSPPPPIPTGQTTITGDTPYQNWNQFYYQPTDLIVYDDFSTPTLNDENWSPGLITSFGTDHLVLALNQPPNIIPPPFTTWTTWQSAGPDFDAEIFDPYPYGGGTNTTGDHLVGGGPDGLQMICSPTSYPSKVLGMAHQHGAAVKLFSGDNRVLLKDTNRAELVTTAPTAPGSRVLTFASVPSNVVFGMTVVDLTHPDQTYIPAPEGRNTFPYEVPNTVESFTATTITLQSPTGSNGVPQGDSIEVRTTYSGGDPYQPPFFNDHVMEIGTRYYMIGDGIPDDSNFVYDVAIALDWHQNTVTGDWTEACCSADGQRMYATTSTGVYRSTNAGTTWTLLTSTPAITTWLDICTSADGMSVAALANGQAIQISLDGGDTWTGALTPDTPADNPGALAWDQICCSDDFTILYATVDGGGVQALYKSVDSGTNFNVVYAAPLLMLAVDCSADGSIVLMAPFLDDLYVSLNYGVTWTHQKPKENNYLAPWEKVAVSDDGTHMVAIENGGNVYTSPDTGANWTKQFRSPNGNLQGIALSGDGTKFMIGDTTNGVGYLYISLDFGFTFLPFKTAPMIAGSWDAVACSRNFDVFVACNRGAAIYSAAGNPLPCVFLTEAPTITADVIVSISPISWVSAGISGSFKKFVFPPTGAFFRWNVKYPDCSFGQDVALAFYPDGSEPALSNFSLESGYNEFDPSVSANRQFLIGYFDGTTGGIITPQEMNLDFHTWGFEYWPGIAATVFLDNQIQHSTAGVIFNGTINGSTLTMTDQMPVIGQTIPGIVSQVTVNKWLHFPGSSETLYLHDGEGNTWTVYDKATNAPANLSVGPIVMAVSSFDTSKPHANMYGRNLILLVSEMFVQASFFHTVADFVTHPGPYITNVKYMDLHDLPTR